MNINLDRVQDIIDRQWKRINPYYADEFNTPEYADTKNIISILDDFYSVVSDVQTDEFVKPISSFFEQAAVLRGRRGKWDEEVQLAPPSIEVAKANNIINRWNPPDKRFLYLAVGNADVAQETVFAEMRAKAGEEITIGSFALREYAIGGKIVNLNFEGISHEEIFSEPEKTKKQIVSEVIRDFKASKRVPSEAAIKREIDARHGQTESTVKIFCGRLLLKEIGDVIFVPLDSSEDIDAAKKDICYKSFHVLANYFEEKGYAGIAFPSTRMRLKGKHGENLVLFDADCAHAREETMRTLTV